MMKKKKKRGFGGDCGERVIWKLEEGVKSVMGQRGRRLDGDKKGRRGGERYFSPLLVFFVVLSVFRCSKNPKRHNKQHGFGDIFGYTPLFL